MSTIRVRIPVAVHPDGRYVATRSLFYNSDEGREGDTFGLAVNWMRGEARNCRLVWIEAEVPLPEPVAPPTPAPVIPATVSAATSAA